VKPDMSQRVLEHRPDVYHEINSLFNRISMEWSPATAQALFEKFMKEKEDAE
jgi:4-diphosphocytidyl-2C-methyl-D-erythritol kinase